MWKYTYIGIEVGCSVALSCKPALLRGKTIVADTIEGQYTGSTVYCGRIMGSGWSRVIINWHGNPSNYYYTRHFFKRMVRSGEWRILQSSHHSMIGGPNYEREGPDPARRTYVEDAHM